MNGDPCIKQSVWYVQVLLPLSATEISNRKDVMSRPFLEPEFNDNKDNLMCASCNTATFVCQLRR